MIFVVKSIWTVLLGFEGAVCTDLTSDLSRSMGSGKLMSSRLLVFGLNLQGKSQDLVLGKPFSTMFTTMIENMLFDHHGYIGQDIHTPFCVLSVYIVSVKNYLVDLVVIWSY